jgi:hypothetical protein
VKYNYVKYRVSMGKDVPLLGGVEISVLAFLTSAPDGNE